MDYIKINDNLVKGSLLQYNITHMISDNKIVNSDTKRIKNIALVQKYINFIKSDKLLLLLVKK